MTVSPSSLSTGIDSPVASDSSTALCPETTTPSVGIFSPGLTTIRSPTRTSEIGTSCSPSSRRILALRASRDSSFWMAAEVRPLARVSTYLPVRWIAMIIAPTPA